MKLRTNCALHRFKSLVVALGWIVSDPALHVHASGWAAVEEWRHQGGRDRNLSKGRIKARPRPPAPSPPYTENANPTRFLGGYVDLNQKRKSQAKETGRLDR